MRGARHAYTGEREAKRGGVTLPSVRLLRRRLYALSSVRLLRRRPCRRLYLELYAVVCSLRLVLGLLAYVDTPY